MFSLPDSCKLRLLQVGVVDNIEFNKFSSRCLTHRGLNCLLHQMSIDDLFAVIYHACTCCYIFYRVTGIIGSDINYNRGRGCGRIVM